MRLVIVLLLAAAALPAQSESAAHQQKALELANKRQWDEARSEYLEAIRLDPKNASARLDLARLQVMARQYEPALASVNTVLQLEPDNLDAELVRATALIGLRKPGVARLFLLDAIKKHPDHPELLFQLGVVSMADRRFDDALDAFQKVWKAEPANPRGLAGVSEVLLAQKEGAKAVETVQAEAAKAPDRRDLQLLLGNTATRAEKFPVAIAAFENALGSAPEAERVDLLLRLAEVQRRNHDVPASIATLEKARGIAPQNAKVLATYGMTLDTAGRRQEAAEAYAATLAIEPKNALVLNNYAFLLADTGGDLKKALELAQKARDVIPNAAEINDTVGWIYVKANMIDAAVGLFQLLTSKHPDNASFRYHYAVALDRKGDKAGAIRELQEAVKRGAAGADLQQIKDLLSGLQ